jgi:hypothetical protein
VWLCARQVGNGACHFERPVRAAGRPAQPRGCHIQKLHGVSIQQDVLVYGLALQRHIGATLPVECPLARRGAALADAVG